MYAVIKAIGNGISFMYVLPSKERNIGSSRNVTDLFSVKRYDLKIVWCFPCYVKTSMQRLMLRGSGGMPPGWSSSMASIQ